MRSNLLNRWRERERTPGRENNTCKGSVARKKYSEEKGLGGGSGGRS